MTLEERVVRLEQQNRWLKGLWMAVVLLAVCGVTAGAAFQKPGRVEASHFVLTDGEHQVGEWYVAGRGATFLMRDFSNQQPVLIQSGNQ
jgi:hypothetical protein